jgi:hypothetical protein
MGLLFGLLWMSFIIGLHVAVAVGMLKLLGVP